MLTNTITLAFLFMSDDIAGLFEDHTDETAQFYETRIADLRVEIDRLNSRQYAAAGNYNLQMQELVQQQELLSEQHQYVSALARMAGALGIETVADAGESTGVGTGVPTDIADISANIETMMSESQAAVDAISEAAQTSTDSLLSGLRQIGVAPLAYSPTAAAVGGPLLALTEDDTNAMVQKANAVVAQFRQLQLAQQSLRDAPVHPPIGGSMRISSGFGQRVDPFVKRLGFHSGIDYPAGAGTLVHSAGAGKIVYAGEKSGYGNVIEVAHENGLITRYAHLSAILVKIGQQVSTGEGIGKVGSTGRSTGPHLHFEVRRGDTPLNPQKYLDTGIKLSRFL